MNPRSKDLASDPSSRHLDGQFLKWTGKYLARIRTLSDQIAVDFQNSVFFPATDAIMVATEMCLVYLCKQTLVLAGF